MKKALSLFLALLMLVSVFAFAGCSGEDDPKKTKPEVKTEGNKTTDTTDPNAVLDHEVKNLNGHEFKFISRATNNAHLATHEIYAEVLNGDKINDAVFSRNAQLQIQYNAEITEVQTERPTYDYKEALVAGEYVADFFFDASIMVKTIMNTSLLADLHSLNNMHLEKNWYDQGIIEGLTVDGKLFCVTGDMATLDDRACWMMQFNKDLINDAMQQSTSGLFDDYKADADNGFYRFIIDGKWTADAMYEIMTLAKDDKNGDGVIDYENDILGYVGERANNYFHVFASGVTLSQRQPDGSVILPDTLSSELLDAWAAFKPVLTSEYRLNSDVGAGFRSGRSAFYACNLGMVLKNNDIEINFGLAPMPKARVGQDKYYAVASGAQFGVYCIPMTAAKAEDAVSNGFVDGVEQAAYFLEAFGYYSIDTLTFAFYDQVLSKQLIQDQASRTTLAMALEHKNIDPYVLFSFGNIQEIFSEAGSPFGADSFGNDLTYDTVASKYEVAASGARTAFETWRETINASV